MAKGGRAFCQFCFYSLWNLLFQMQDIVVKQPTTCGFKTRSNEWDLRIFWKKTARRTREWSFQRIPVWTLRLGVKTREPRGGMGDVFFCHDPTEKIRISCEMTRFIRFEFWKKWGYNSYNSIFFHSYCGLLRSSQISTLNLKGFPCSSSQVKTEPFQNIWRLEERLPWFVCEAGGWIERISRKSWGHVFLFLVIQISQVVQVLFREQHITWHTVLGKLHALHSKACFLLNRNTACPWLMWRIVSIWQVIFTAFFFVEMLLRINQLKWVSWRKASCLKG